MAAGDDPITSTLQDQYSSPDVGKINSLKAIFRFDGKGNSSQVPLLSRFCAEPLVVGKKLMDTINQNTAMRLSSVTAFTHVNDVVHLPVPESVPNDIYLNFAIKLTGTPANQPATLVAQKIPAATIASGTQLKAVAESIASDLLLDANIDECDYIEQSVRRSRY